MTTSLRIYCAGCTEDVQARLTTGAEVYPHRRDLSALPYWKCDICGNYVGCHHKTKEPTKPLGIVPTAELRRARRLIHSIIDPLWANGMRSRKHVYAALSEKIGYEYHTAEIRSVEDAMDIYKVAKEIF